LRAALGGKLDNVPTRADAVFGLQVPTVCPDVPASILEPRATWPKAASYDIEAQKLAVLFQKNFEHFADVPAGIREAGPRIA
jgi:phosphoenolpyruvate carboxykinase (ATP)